jgi:carbamoyltransferase
MQLVADVLPEKRQVPAVTHVDGSARIQTVSKEHCPLYHQLLSAFEAKTGCPLVINTSFNVRGEPVVCTPEDALKCFIRTHMDVLVMGPFVLLKEEQGEFLGMEDARTMFPLD